MRVIVFGAIVVLFTSVLGWYNMRDKPAWAFDGYVYGIRAQVDAGVPYAIALHDAREIYRTKPAMQPAKARASLNSETPLWWNLFAVRALYPAVASLLWRFAGFQSLFYLSLGAYVAAAALLYTLFLRFSTPAVAAVVALFCILNPETQLIGRSDLTDMPAFALLAGALLAAMRYAERGRSIDLAWFAIVAAMLSFTRPVPYDLACAALPLLVAGVWRRGIDLIGISLALTIAVAFVMHLTRAEVPPVDHFGRAVFVTLWVSLVSLVAHAAAPLAAIALYAMRRRADVLICGGMLASIVLTILADPYPTDVMRVVVLPSLIPLGCGFAIAAQAALAAGRAYRNSDAIVREWSGSESILAAPRQKSSHLA
ncbi:MAG: hypothetical protein JO322_02990 [Candidatus Eremiobacteraeota bacterium]|nr:hypothetical protein [Candidatus Eremiobacteraeota bacterium]